jgi:8-oxo-dGTP pyrophosphatase MutT (NUDIX family)
MIENFENFIAENKRSKFGAAGIAIIWGTKILLVHPTDGSWQKRTLGIPKGSIEEGETELEAALRETFEETGIQLRADQLEPTIHSVIVYSHKDKKPVGTIFYAICRIEDPAKIGLPGDRVPKTQLQLEEVDWAGFMEISEAYEKMIYSQLIILDRVKG